MVDIEASLPGNSSSSGISEQSNIKQWNEDLLLSRFLYDSEFLLWWVQVGHKCKIELLMAIHHVLGRYEGLKIISVWDGMTVVWEDYRDSPT